MKYLLLFITLLIVALAILEHQTIYNQAYAWKLIPRPERLTELYFTTPNNLPSTYTPGVVQTVDFTVHNVEYRPTSYSYKVLQIPISGASELQLTGGQFTLDQNQTEHTTISMNLADQGPRSHVEIVLSYDGITFGHDSPTPESQTISYWINEQKVAP